MRTIGEVLRRDHSECSGKTLIDWRVGQRLRRFGGASKSGAPEGIVRYLQVCEGSIACELASRDRDGGRSS